MKNPYSFLKKIRPIELALIVKRILRVKRFVYRHEDLLFWLDPASELGEQVIKNKIFEPQLTKYISNTLKPGDVFVDVGANEGWFSIYAAKKVGPAGKVFAIEPQQRLWEVLIKNFFINGIINYVLVPCALGTEEQDKELILNPDLNNGGSSFVNARRSYFWPRQTTPIRRMDSIFEQYNLTKVDLMKMDIEGYEYFALQSGVKIFDEKRVEKIVVDVHTSQLEKLGISEDSIQIFFEQKGYSYTDEDGIGVFIINGIS